MDKRRILAAALTAVMLLGMLPVALAAEPQPTEAADELGDHAAENGGRPQQRPRDEDLPGDLRTGQRDAGGRRVRHGRHQQSFQLRRRDHDPVLGRGDPRRHGG